MNRKTGMLIPPSLEEVQLAAAKIGLPDHEAQKFFYYYESNGWRVGKNKMVSFVSALSHWKLVWLEGRNGQRQDASRYHNGGKTWAQRQVERMASEEL